MPVTMAVPGLRPAAPHRRGQPASSPTGATRCGTWTTCSWRWACAWRAGGPRRLQISRPMPPEHTSSRRSGGEAASLEQLRCAPAGRCPSSLAGPAPPRARRLVGPDLRLVRAGGAPMRTLAGYRAPMVPARAGVARAGLPRLRSPRCRVARSRRTAPIWRATVAWARGREVLEPGAVDRSAAPPTFLAHLAAEEAAPGARSPGRRRPSPVLLRLPGPSASAACHPQHRPTGLTAPPGRGPAASRSSSRRSTACSSLRPPHGRRRRPGDPTPQTTPSSRCSTAAGCRVADRCAGCGQVTSTSP